MDRATALHLTVSKSIFTYKEPPTSKKTEEIKNHQQKLCQEVIGAYFVRTIGNAQSDLHYWHAFAPFHAHRIQSRSVHPDADFHDSTTLPLLRFGSWGVHAHPKRSLRTGNMCFPRDSFYLFCFICFNYFTYFIGFDLFDFYYFV
jgi:hypothetical protein